MTDSPEVRAIVGLPAGTAIVHPNGLTSGAFAIDVPDSSDDDAPVQAMDGSGQWWPIEPGRARLVHTE